LAEPSKAPQTKDFFDLVKTGPPQDVQAAIDKGADLKGREEDRGRTPLMAAAAWNPNPEVITTLLKAGADIKARDENGATVLMAATYNTNPEAITMTLLKAGADINAQNKVGMTPLIMFAARYNTKPEVITTLLNAGADAKVKDSDGKTAFDYAQLRPDLKDTDVLRQLQKASQ
jgi:ankyrin repeat protein